MFTVMRSKPKLFLPKQKGSDWAVSPVTTTERPGAGPGSVHASPQRDHLTACVINLTNPPMVTPISEKTEIQSK